MRGSNLFSMKISEPSNFLKSCARSNGYKYLGERWRFVAGQCILLLQNGNIEDAYALLHKHALSMSSVWIAYVMYCGK